jgi:hypothetical protein
MSIRNFNDVLMKYGGKIFVFSANAKPFGLLDPNPATRDFPLQGENGEEALGEFRSWQKLFQSFTLAVGLLRGGEE